MLRPYLRYFGLIAKNWNILVAGYMVYHEIRGNCKYGGDTMEMESLDYLRVKGKNKKHGSFYQASAYSLLEKAFEFLLQQGVTGAVVDFGSGKGRILIVAAHYGFKVIRGIEFAPELCSIARKNIENTLRRHRSVETSIYCLDAVDYEVQPNDESFFFFNPFTQEVMIRVLRNLLQSVKNHPRTIYVVYLNPVCEELFLSAGFVREYHTRKLRYIEMTIYSYCPHNDAEESNVT